MHKTSSYFCSISTPKGLVQADATLEDTLTGLFCKLCLQVLYLPKENPSGPKRCKNRGKWIIRHEFQARGSHRILDKRFTKVGHRWRCVQFSRPVCQLEPSQEDEDSGTCEHIQLKNDLGHMSKFNHEKLEVIARHTGPNWFCTYHDVLHFLSAPSAWSQAFWRSS